MKTLSIVLLSVIAVATCTRDKFTNAGVVRNCTGTYLHIDGKDYHVCNVEKLRAQKDGEPVKVVFSRISECKGSAVRESVCEMLYPSEGWIEVKKIK